MYKQLFLCLMLSTAFADGNLDTNAIETRQLMSMPPQSTAPTTTSAINYANQPDSESPIANSHTNLDNDTSRLNQDGTVGITKDTKMQVNPNGVTLKLGY